MGILRVGGAAATAFGVNSWEASLSESTSVFVCAEPSVSLRPLPVSAPASSSGKDKGARSDGFSPSAATARFSAGKVERDEAEAADRCHHGASVQKAGGCL